ncbi:MAG: NADPH-dependent F420 reductase [Chloroflexi bacterium]|nr:NADPH-dependent F420 reductase [Chloroflexota bacterium]
MARLAFIGGTGPEGTGLAIRFAKSGHAIYIGSRSEERAAETVAKIHEASPGADLYGGPNLDGALKADFVFVTVPASAHAELLKELEEAIADKIVVDTVVPMSFEGDDGPVAAMPEAGSAAEEAASLLPNAKVVSAFHHLDAKQLQRIDRPMQGDVIVCGDDKAAKQKVMALVEEINYVRALDGGGLKNSRFTEQLTVLLVHINKIYQAHTGIRVTGV